MDDKFTFRRVLPSDKDEVFRICSKIWDGHDFLPSKFDEWVADEKGYFAALLHDGKLIGLGKLTYLTETDVLLEGLRKDQDIDIKGVAFMVTNFLLERLKNIKGLTSLRFCTYFQNIASIKTGERCGFNLWRKYSFKSLYFEDHAVPNVPSYAPVQPITDERKILEYVRKSPLIPARGNILFISWMPYPYSDELFIEHFIKPGKCFGIVENGEIKALAAYFSRQGFNLPFFDAENFSYAKSLMNFLFAYAYTNGLYGVNAILPTELERVKNYFVDLGLTSWEQEDDLFIYDHPVTW